MDRFASVDRRVVSSDTASGHVSEFEPGKPGAARWIAIAMAAVFASVAAWFGLAGLGDLPRHAVEWLMVAGLGLLGWYLGQILTLVAGTLFSTLRRQSPVFALIGLGLMTGLVTLPLAG